jgi:hypothetical protein
MSKMELISLVSDFAGGIESADAKRPRSKKWRPGIGPHDEPKVIELVTAEMRCAQPSRYQDLQLEFGYPESRERCDICIGEAPDWAIEVKALRMLGDKGVVVQGRDEVSKLLSPYPKQRSALTDCWKLAKSGFECRKAIMIYAYDHRDYPMMELVDAFELLAARIVTLGDRQSSAFSGLIHPIHQDGQVFAWELR